MDAGGGLNQGEEYPFLPWGRVGNRAAAAL